MTRTLEELMDILPPERRIKVEASSAELIAEVEGLKAFRQLAERSQEQIAQSAESPRELGRLQWLFGPPNQNITRTLRGRSVEEARSRNVLLARPRAAKVALESAFLVA